MPTPNYGWPFPTPGSTVDIPRDIEALAREIDTTMFAKLARTPACAVEQTVAQPLTSGQWTIINFDTETLDTANMHSSATNPSRITIPVAGIYRLSGGVAYASSTVGTRSTSWTLNGTIFGQAMSAQGVSFTGAFQLPAMPIVALFAAGDYVELRAWHTAGSSLNTSPTAQYRCFANVEYVSP